VEKWKKGKFGMTARFALSRFSKSPCGMILRLVERESYFPRPVYTLLVECGGNCGKACPGFLGLWKVFQGAGSLIRMGFLRK
jgi:hypothetical protein